MEQKEKERPRIKVKTSLAGSSDYRRVKSARAILAENHVKNMSFFATIKATESKEEPIIITEKYLLSRYSEVYIIDRWCPISKFIGSLVFMYNNDNYKFK